jgi:hypothetical protein
LDGRKLFFDDNEQGLPFDQGKVFEIERVCDDHADKELRAYKTLGVYFDETLSLNRHVEVLVAKLSRAIYMLSRVRNVLPANALMSIYIALFHSHLLYCPTVIACTSNANIEKIVKMQKKPSESSLTPHIMHTLATCSHSITFYHTNLSSNNQKSHSCTLITTIMHLPHLTERGSPMQSVVALVSSAMQMITTFTWRTPIIYHASPCSHSLGSGTWQALPNTTKIH